VNGASGPLGFEAFGAACGLAVVAGALSVLAPGLSMLTASLATLAVAGWAAGRRRTEGLGTGRALRVVAYLPPFAALAAAGLLFLDPADPLGPWRGLALGLGLVPLWTVERLRTRTPSGFGRVA
jgi:hypothetical protein